MLLILDEQIDFGINGRLQHPSGSFADDLIEGAAIVELLAKGKHFRIELAAHWNVMSFCRSLAHGVSLCPRRAVEV